MEFFPGLCPKNESSKEQLFQKEVCGAFSTTNLAEWLQTNGINEVVLSVSSRICVSLHLLAKLWFEDSKSISIRPQREHEVSFIPF